MMLLVAVKMSVYDTDVRYFSHSGPEVLFQDSWMMMMMIFIYFVHFIVEYNICL